MASSFILTQPKIKSKIVSHSDSKHSLTIEPLLPGFGYTLGNSLRRVLLSSMPGSAVTRIRINDIAHEYQPIPGIVEDALDIVLNLKLIRARILNDEERVVLNLVKTQEGDIFASDFNSGNKVEILNPDLYICSLNKDSSIQIEIEINKGVGYLPVEAVNLADNPNPQDILVDAVFSPIINAAYEVEQVRVGDKTNFDKLTLNFETDKTVSPFEVSVFALEMIIDILKQILSGLDSSEENTNTIKNDVNEAVKLQTNSTSLKEEISLPSKIKNILEKNGIVTNSELIQRVEEIENFAGITEKSLTSIKDYIKTIS